MNSKPLIDDGRQIPVYKVHTGPEKHALCVPKKDFEDLDAERRRLRQALIDRGVDPNDIPPVETYPGPTEAAPQAACIGDVATTGGAMPKYRCHKIVWALKIKRAEHRNGEVCLFFEDANYAPISKTPHWEAKFNPQAGGYYVVYADNYTSFSPAKAFEEGYTRLS